MFPTATLLLNTAFLSSITIPAYEPQTLDPSFLSLVRHKDGEKLVDFFTCTSNCNGDSYMSTKKSSRKSHDKNKKGRLTEKAMSFHGQPAEEMVGKLRRPRTVPDLISCRIASSTEMARPKLTKLLLNVTVQRSLGPLQVLISPELTVSDLVAAALRQYCKEGRRPILPSLDPSGFGLHYSQFSLESLDPDEKLMELGSRNFFLCPKAKRSATTAGSCDEDGGVGFDYAVMTTSAATSSACSKEAETVTKTGVGWLRFMNFLQ